jgi:hypothetical protein
VTEEIRFEPAASDRSRRGRSADRRRRRRAWTRGLAAAALLGLAFFAGLAVGKAVEDGPDPGGAQTLVRTLEPVTVAPRARTVTVTVTSP